MVLYTICVGSLRLETEGWLVLLLCVVVLVCSALKIPKMYKFKKVTIVNFESFFSVRCTVICRLFKKGIKNLKTFVGLCNLKLQLLGSRRLTRIQAWFAGDVGQFSS